MTPGRRRRRRLLRLLVVVAVLAAGIVVVLRSLADRVLVTSAECQVRGPGQNSWSLDPDQAANAAVITTEGMRRSLPDHAVTIALATALQESKLRDLDYGDLDSVGLFQQRPSEGWGPRARLLDPRYAAGAFYDRLVKVPSWRTLPVTEAAQAVQHSAAGDAYATREAEARALARALTGETRATLSCAFPSRRLQPGATAAAEAAAEQTFGSRVLGVSLPEQRAWAVAAWAVATAGQTGVREVRIENRRWQARERWDATRQATGAGVVVVR